MRRTTPPCSRALREIWKEAGLVDEREVTLRIPRRTHDGRMEHDILTVSRGDRLRFTRPLVRDGIAIPEGTIVTVDAILPGEDGERESEDKPVALGLRLPGGKPITLRPDALAPRRGQGASVRRPALCHAYAATPRDPRRATPHHLFRLDMPERRDRPDDPTADATRGERPLAVEASPRDADRPGDPPAARPTAQAHGREEHGTPADDDQQNDANEPDPFTDTEPEEEPQASRMISQRP